MIFFFNDTATTEIYTLSLHDALPIYDYAEEGGPGKAAGQGVEEGAGRRVHRAVPEPDRKSTRLNSSHQIISYAVFCLKKKNKKINHLTPRTKIRDSYISHQAPA